MNDRLLTIMCIYRALYTSKDFEEDFSAEYPEILTSLQAGNPGALSDDECEMVWAYYNKWRDTFYLV